MSRELTATTVDLDNVRLNNELRRLRTRLKAAEEGLIDILRATDGDTCQIIADETLKLIRE